MNILEYSVEGWGGTAFRATLLHPTNKKEQFEADIIRLLRERGKDYLEQEEYWVEDSRWCEFILPDLIKLGYIEATIEGIGFSQINSLTEKTPQVEKWKGMVGEELFNLALAKSREIQKEIYNQ